MAGHRDIANTRRCSLLKKSDLTYEIAGQPPAPRAQRTRTSFVFHNLHILKVSVRAEGLMERLGLHWGHGSLSERETVSPNSQIRSFTSMALPQTMKSRL